MFSKVLFPVDLEDVVTAEHALRYLNGMLSNGQELHILGVLPGFNMPLVASYFPEGTVEHAINAMEQQLNELAEQNLSSKLSWFIHVAEGVPHKEIVKKARKLNCDLIAIPSRNHGFVEKVLLGSVTAKVVEQAGCSVFVMR
ncbi:universal stress protein [Pontibacterium granulatum]|uniref:universal stress protein n=1 Tax=Pontibacterium granulatum TaxID=2036029 RepID=UPI00249C3421|nr:universal stress protein [Pontibacterium granulatum]MDI3325680.1 universal stress protein [Pontibacterium granulatum]